MCVCMCVCVYIYIYIYIIPGAMGPSGRLAHWLLLWACRAARAADIFGHTGDRMKRMNMPNLPTNIAPY